VEGIILFLFLFFATVCKNSPNKKTLVEVDETNYINILEISWALVLCRFITLIFGLLLLYIYFHS
jgi:hypothetical protein